MADEHDFVVIGGGAVGRVRANRPLADLANSVSLLAAPAGA